MRHGVAMDAWPANNCRPRFAARSRHSPPRGERNAKIYAVARTRAAICAQPHRRSIGIMATADFLVAGIPIWECLCDRLKCGRGHVAASSERCMRLLRHFHRDVDNSRKDKARVLMEAHYQRDRQRFSRSFVIGNRGDCCAPSAGLTWGMSFNNWASARALLRANADYAPARREKRQVWLGDIYTICRSLHP